MAETSSRMTDRFAEFVEGFSFERLPDPVIIRTKEILYDGFGMPAVGYCIKI